MKCFMTTREKKGGKMETLKVFLVMGIVISILAICAYAPGICIDRFMLPDGCANGCGAAHSPCCRACSAPETPKMACR